MSGNNSYSLEDYQDELELKIIAFKKIYKALWRAQPNNEYLKTNFLEHREHLSANELAEDIEKRIKDSPKGRTAHAWQLASQYYMACHSENLKLVAAIIKFARENTHFLRMTFFSNSINYMQENVANLLAGIELDHLQCELRQTPRMIRVR